MLSAINNKTKNIEIKKPVKNINRTVGAMLSGYLARKFGKSLFDLGKNLHIECEGTGGQSFGAFLIHGVTLDLTGEANDYTGKGLSGGTIIVKPLRNLLGLQKTIS